MRHGTRREPLAHGAPAVRERKQEHAARSLIRSGTLAVVPMSGFVMNRKQIARFRCIWRGILATCVSREYPDITIYHIGAVKHGHVIVMYVPPFRGAHSRGNCKWPFTALVGTDDSQKSTKTSQRRLQSQWRTQHMLLMVYTPPGRECCINAWRFGLVEHWHWLSHFVIPSGDGRMHSLGTPSNTQTAYFHSLYRSVTQESSLNEHWHATPHSASPVQRPHWPAQASSTTVIEPQSAL